MPKVKAALMRKVGNPDCFDLKAREYTVVELEQGVRCQQDYIGRLENRVHSLQGAIKARE